MPKKTIIFIVILALITGGLIFLAVRETTTPQGQQPGGEEPAPSGESQPTATLYFENSNITVTPGEQVTQNILLDAGGQAVSGAQIILEFDPSQLTVDSLTAPATNFFGASPSEYVVLINNIDQEAGIAEFTISVPVTGETSQPLTGIDNVLTVTFTPIAGYQGTTSLTIVNNTTGENTSIITSPDYLTDNILLNATPLQVTVQ